MSMPRANMPHHRRRACVLLMVVCSRGVESLMAGAPACPRCTIAMAVEPPGTLPQVSTPPIIEDVESAMAADMQAALADAQQANVVLPPHEQLALDPKAQARHDQIQASNRGAFIMGQLPSGRTPGQQFTLQANAFANGDQTWECTLTDSVRVY